jgi:predicted P-loop ATPase
VIDTIAPYVDAGFAVHWLHPRKKNPIGEDWQNKPVHTLETLRASYRSGNNVGVRLGEPSRVGGGYLHVLDMDLRIAELAPEAWGALRDLLPKVDLNGLPCVKSGSGGESRHLYFVTSAPFRSKLLAKSEGKHRGEDGKWHRDWEIELFGTGKQVAMPSSIHPSGKPYVWEREFDFDMLDLGITPEIAASNIEALGVVEDEAFAFESREPLEFKPGQMETELSLIPVSDLSYDDWLMLGQAIHHQTGGAEAGWALWLEHTRRSTKYDGDDRTMRRKWRSFGRYRGKPVTMATVRLWAQAARTEALIAEFDDEPEGDALTDEFDDIIGGNQPPKATPSEDEFDEITSTKVSKPKRAALEWVSLLDINEEGAYKPTLHNIELIVKNDVRLVGLPRMNEFTQETVQRTPPGHKRQQRANSAKETRQLSGRVWEVRDPINGDIWTSARDYAIRSILEAPKTQGGYGIKISDRDLMAATVLSAWENSFHPVREYLLGLQWDGKPRIGNLFVDYLGSPDNAYTREVGRLMMVAAVARVFEPGHKWDFAVILEGLQGRGKSTFIRTLGRRWFAELEVDFHDGKEMVEKMQGAWIMEIPELSGFNRADVRSIKAFISRQTDKVRLAYERRAQDFPRQCIMIGSTNDKEYLKDDTGGRRFFPMPCTVDMIDIARLRRNIDQLWAEARAVYLQMREEWPESEGDLPLYLMDAEAATEAVRLQETRRVESADDATAGQIADWLAKPVATGDMGDPNEGRQRTETCLIEIWCECLGNDRKAYTQVGAQSVGRAMALIPGWTYTGAKHRFPKYGQQRKYERT